MTALRSRMIEDMKLKNLSTRTIDAYVSRVGFFARHFGRSPEQIGRDEVRSYLLHLIQNKKVSWSVYNQTLCALRFLKSRSLPNRRAKLPLSRMRPPPSVLRPDSVWLVFRHTGPGGMAGEGKMPRRIELRTFPGVISTRRDGIGPLGASCLQLSGTHLNPSGS